MSLRANNLSFLNNKKSLTANTNMIQKLIIYHVIQNSCFPFSHSINKICKHMSIQTRHFNQAYLTLCNQSYGNITNFFPFSYYKKEYQILEYNNNIKKLVLPEIWPSLIPTS